MGLFCLFDCLFVFNTPIGTDIPYFCSTAPLLVVFSASSLTFPFIFTNGFPCLVSYLPFHLAPFWVLYMPLVFRIFGLCLFAFEEGTFCRNIHLQLPVLFSPSSGSCVVYERCDRRWTLSTLLACRPKSLLVVQRGCASVVPVLLHRLLHREHQTRLVRHERYDELSSIPSFPGLCCPF